jgi:hypothetical protein
MSGSPADRPADGERGSRTPSTPPDGSDPVLPDRAAEDRDEAWGDAPAGREDDWYRRERPPHHD